MAKKDKFDPNFYSGNSSPEDFGDSRNKVYSSYAGASRGFSFGTVIRLLGIVLFLCLLAMLVRRFKGDNGFPSFQSLFETLSNFKPPAQIPFIPDHTGEVVKFFSVPFFGELLGGLLDLFTDLLNVPIFFWNGLSIVVGYIGVFFQWLFVF